MKSITPQIFNPFELPVINTKAVQKETPDPKSIKDQRIHNAQRLQTIKNYRKYVQQYNDMVGFWNDQIKRINTIVERNLNKAKGRVVEQPSLGKISTSDYNRAMMELNNKEPKAIYKLKPYKKVSKALEATFIQIMYGYSVEMNEKSNAWKESRKLDKVRINVEELHTREANGVRVLPYTKNTIHNHINRLVEAGILFDYEFHGYFIDKQRQKRQGKPSSYHINPNILVVFDEKTKNSLTTANQLFNLSPTKNFGYNYRNTGTILNNIKMKELVNKKQAHQKGKFFQLATANNFYKNTKGVSQKNQSSGQNGQKTPLKDFYKNTKGVSQQKNKAAARENCQISDYLYNKIIDKNDFTELLTNGQFNDYRFKFKRTFEEESVRGNLLKEEFREILLQEFLKIAAAKLWKNKTVYLPTWRAAYNLCDKHLLRNHNGSIPNKVALLYMFDNLVWRVKFAARYCKNNPDYNLLFPSEYFNPSRKHKKSGGFEYTLKFLKQHLEAKSKAKEIEQKKARIEAKKNKRFVVLEQVEKKVQDLANGKITLNDLYNYIKYNSHIPNELLKKIPSYIEKAYKC